MDKSKEAELDATFKKIVSLIYRNECIWSGIKTPGVTCGGMHLDHAHLIPCGDRYFRWDFNNCVLMCRNHHLWWHGTWDVKLSQIEATNALMESYPDLSNFMVENRGRMFQWKPDIEAIEKFMLEHSQEAISKGFAPFPSLYGRKLQTSEVDNNDGE